jgi:hypothetical protein
MNAKKQRGEKMKTRLSKCSRCGFTILANQRGGVCVDCSIRYTFERRGWHFTSQLMKNGTHRYRAQHGNTIIMDYLETSLHDNLMAWNRGDLINSGGIALGRPG